MKKLIGISLVTLFLGFSSAVNAQDTGDKVEAIGKDLKEDAKEAGKKTKKAAKKVAKKTSEVASKGYSTVVDQVYKDKVGPNGQTIYIDNRSQYYWIDNEGHKHYVTEADLKNKE